MKGLRRPIGLWHLSLIIPKTGCNKNPMIKNYKILEFKLILKINNSKTKKLTKQWTKKVDEWINPVLLKYFYIIF